VSSIVKAVYSVAERADEVELRIQISRANPLLSLVMRELSQRGATPALGHLIDHGAIGDRRLSRQVVRSQPERTCCSQSGRGFFAARRHAYITTVLIVVALASRSAHKHQT